MRKFTFAIRGNFVVRILLVSLLSLFIMNAGQALAFEGPGDGTEEEPYMVSTCQQLQSIEDDLGGHYVQTGDVDCSDSEDWNGGIGFLPIGQGGANFTGVYDGQNFTINDLVINEDGTEEVGLFRYPDGATIQRVHLRGGYVDSESAGYNGTLVARATGDTTISDCSSTTEIRSVAQSGLIGYMSGGSVSRCWYQGEIDSSSSYTGGLIGWITNTDVSDVYTQGTLNGHTYSGALIGGVDGGSIINAYSSMNVVSTAGIYSGGLTGFMSDQGVGEGSPNLTVSNVFFAGSLTESGDHVGAITSFIDNTDFDGVYYDQDTCGCEEALGTGTPDSGAVTAVNTDGSEPNYFKGNNSNEPIASWDFDTVWQVNTGDFPTIQMGASPEDSDDDGIPNLVEDAGPNGGDADGSGVLDSAEPYSASMVNPVTGHYSSLVVYEMCRIVSAVFIDESGVTTEGDGDYEFPGGLVDFRIICNAEPGLSATISQVYYGVNYSEDLVVRKFIPGSGFQTIDAEISEDEIDGEPVIFAEYSVTDGGPLDIDGATDGSIEDPAGLALSTAESEALAETGSNITMLTILAYTTVSVAALALAYQLRKRLHA